MKTRNKSIIYLLLGFLFINLFYSCSIKKGYQALDIYNYFKAKKVFEQKAKRKKPGASYGLAMIYFRTDNPFHDYDSAYVYVLKAKEGYQLLNDKKREKLKPYNLDSIQINNLFNKICQEAYQAGVDSNNISIYNHYIHFYTQSPLVEKAKKARNALAFQEAIQKNSSDAYENFLDKYPNAIEKSFAKRMYDSTLFKEQTQTNTIKAYKRFVNNFPNSSYLDSAYNKIYSFSTLEGTLKGYRNFIENNPNNPHIIKAWQMMLALSVPQFKTMGLSNFLNNHPNYPQKDYLKQLIIVNDQHLFEVEENKRWGFIDKEGKIHIMPKYDWVGKFYNGIALASINEDSYLINKLGKQIVLSDYDNVNHFTNGYAVVSKNDRYGLINRYGDLVIPIIYDYLSSPSNQLCLAEKDGKYGYVNPQGKIIISIQYQLGSDFNNGLAHVKEDSLYGVINTSGSFFIPPGFDWIGKYQLKSFKAKKNNLFGLINLHNDTLVDFKYKYIGSFHDSLALLVDSNSYVYINFKGDTVFSPKMKPFPGMYSLAVFKDGYARFMRNNRYGLFNKKGVEILNPIYDQVIYFDSSIAITTSKQIYYIVYLKQNKKFKLDVTTSSMTRIGKFFIQLKDTSTYLLLDSSTQLIQSFGNAKVVIIKNNEAYILVSDSNQKNWGIYDINKNKFNLNPGYEKITLLEDGIFKLFKENQAYLYNAHLKKIIWEPSNGH